MTCKLLGYGWATAVELLCTAFQEGPFGGDLAGVDRATGKPSPMPLGHVFIAIDVDALCEVGTLGDQPFQIGIQFRLFSRTLRED